MMEPEPENIVRTDADFTDEVLSADDELRLRFAKLFKLAREDDK